MYETTTVYDTQGNPIGYTIADLMYGSSVDPNSPNYNTALPYYIPTGGTINDARPIPQDIVNSLLGGELSGKSPFFGMSYPEYERITTAILYKYNANQPDMAKWKWPALAGYEAMYAGGYLNEPAAAAAPVVIPAVYNDTNQTASTTVPAAASSGSWSVLYAAIQPYIVPVIAGLVVTVIVLFVTGSSRPERTGRRANV